MVALSLVSLKQLNSLVSYSNQVDHSRRVNTQLYKLENYLKDIDRTERGYVFTHDTMYIRLVHKAISNAFPVITALKDLTSDNPIQQQSVSALLAYLTERVWCAKQDIAYTDTTHIPGPSPYFDDGRKQMQGCMKYVHAMHSEENRIHAIRFKSEKNYQQITSQTLKYLLFVFCIITLLLFLLMLQELYRRVNYQNELQIKIIDLKRSHSELEQIAFAASHDLQEPLRKIQVFSNRILWKKGAELDNDSTNSLERVIHSANRMQELVIDLVSLTSLTKEGELPKETIDLNYTFKDVLSELKENAISKNAAIDLQLLPNIPGHRRQLHLLFKSLIDNALKFTREGVAPIISIHSEKVNGIELSHINKKLQDNQYYKLTISDNGIGFDNQLKDKMFMLFQRLHNQQSQYTGKGIGLSICQRVMANHQGYIMAEGNTGNGAIFKLYFPVEE